MPQLLIIGFVWPEPNSSAAGSRMLQLIECFQAQGYQITFATACAKSSNAFNLESINVKQEPIKLNDSSFDDFLKSIKPDVVIFDRFMTEEQFGWRVTEHCPDAVKILDTEDLHCLRKGRHQALKDQMDFDDSYLFNEFAKREIASIYRCDLSIMISEEEIEILNKKFKVDKSLLAYVPFLVEERAKAYYVNLPKYEERQHFVTIGNFLHNPNYDAVLYLKNAIWPLIRKQLPKAELHIYGAYESQKVLQLKNKKEGFIVKGYAEDVDKTLKQYRVCLAALRFGAGLKGKLIDAMQNGLPCVMTTIAAEGMFGKEKPNGFIEDNDSSFANKAVELYQDKTIWNTMQNNGYSVLNSRFNKKYYLEQFSAQMKNLIENIDNHRLQNFTGAMLQHHTMQSTKFMSRWIEEKNTIKK